MRRLTAWLMILFISGCSLYRPALRQGNHISQEQLDKLTVNMTKREVQTILGTPAIVPTLDLNRWDYAYAQLPGNERDKELNFKLVTLYFSNDKLSGYSGDFKPKNLKSK